MAAKSLPATLEGVAQAMAAKAALPLPQAWVLAMLAGAFIALAGFGSTVASCNLLASSASYGLGRLVCGLIFPIGLMMVVVGGGELFTGNCLMVEAWRRKSLTLPQMLQSWCWVYLGNFAGSLVVAAMLWAGGAFWSGGGTVAAAIVKTAAGKAQMGAPQAFFLGIFCNWLVCMGVWLASRSDEPAHKAFLLFFPIWLFVVSGYEHSVANMYYLSAGLLAVADKTAMLAANIPETMAAGLTLAGACKNLTVVTLGNIVGGSVFVGCAYAAAYARR